MMDPLALLDLKALKALKDMMDLLVLQDNMV